MKRDFVMMGVRRALPSPSLISYWHEPDESDNIIIGPKLIEPGGDESQDGGARSFVFAFRLYSPYKVLLIGNWS